MTDTKETIEQRIREHLKNNRSSIEGTFSRDLIAANAVEFENCYNEIEMLKYAAFAETAWGEYLTRRASEFGVERKRAVTARGEVTVTGEAGAYIIRGSLFQTKEGLKFYTTESATIPDNRKTLTIPIEAGSPGTKGNAAENTITEIPYSIPNVYSVTNKAKCTDGADEETDKALLARLLFRVRQPITSGNANHYRDWAMSVDGVGNCKVIPLWNGNGTVKVIIVTSNNESASKELIQNVGTYIEKHRPIGATVTVVSPAPLTIDIRAEVSGKDNYTNDDAWAVKYAVMDYLKETGFGLSYVSLAHIGKILLGVKGITDYKNLTLNGKAQNVMLTNEQIPVCGKVVISCA